MITIQRTILGESLYFWPKQRKMAQPISIETVKTALLELARTDREFFLELWADIIKDVAPASSKPNTSKKNQKNRKKVTFTVLKTKGQTYQFNREEANER